jgi:hypothetical protein
MASRKGPYPAGSGTAMAEMVKARACLAERRAHSLCGKTSSAGKPIMNGFTMNVSDAGSARSRWVNDGGGTAAGGNAPAKPGATTVPAAPRPCTYPSPDRML